MKRVILLFIILLCFCDISQAQNPKNMEQKVVFSAVENKIIPLFLIRNLLIHATDILETPELIDQRNLPVNNSYPWYKTLYAELFILMLLISLIVGSVFLLINRQRQLNQLKLDKSADENCKSNMDFLSNVVHELLKPLNLVLPPIEDLKNNSSNFDEEWRIHIDMIFRNFRHIQKLVNHIVDFKKSEAEILKLKESDSNFFELIMKESSNFEEDYQFSNNEYINESQIRDNEVRFKIFIAEDNEELRNFLVRVFSREYTCFASGDGVDAYNVIKEVMPDVIISDFIMHGMDGFQLCRIVKENRNTCHIPVLLLTAKDAEKQIIAGFNNGADACINKPINIKILLSHVSRMIRNRELIREKYLTQNFMVEIANTLTSKDNEFILRLREILEENIADADFNVNKLANQMNISATQLYRKLKTLTGYSPVEFIRIMKLQKACDLLNQRKNTIKEVCYLVGFNNLSYFVKCFREFFGVTPAVYRDHGLIETGKAETNIES